MMTLMINSNKRSRLRINHKARTMNKSKAVFSTVKPIRKL